MPKRSSFAIAAGLGARPLTSAKRGLGHGGRPAKSRNAADGFYFQLETFLDTWRREGMDEKAVRAALKRAEAASLAMEDVGRRLKGQ